MTDVVITPLRPRQYALALLGLILLWPALINGGPFLFPDSSAYVRGVDAAVVRATGHRTEWTNGDVLRVAGAQSSAVARPGAPPPVAQTKPVLLGRSVFYGVLAYAGALAGTLWVTIVLQALLAGAVLLAFVRHFADPERPRRFATAVAGTAVAMAATPLAWFTSMVMPDFLTGLVVIAAAVLVAGRRRESRAGRCFWLAVASYGALAHSSHVLILIGLALAALLASAAALPSWRPGAAALGLAAAIGLLGEASFSLAVTKATGVAPIRPPFLAARLVEDGPGVAYLRERCGQVDFHLCRYRDRLPVGSDSFLWSENPATGVFQTVPVPEQRVLAAEQGAFVRAVILDRPLDVLASTAAAVGRQFGAWRLSDFAPDVQGFRKDAASLPAPQREAALGGRTALGTWAIALGTAAIPAWSIAGLIAVALACSSAATAPLGRYGLVLAAGWIIDVGVCGALSTAHDRYQARVIWVLALAAVALVPKLARARRVVRSPALRLDRPTR